MHDYRVLNSRTKKQNYPLLRISDLTQQIRCDTIFSSLDLKNAFWQLDVRPSDTKYTAFSNNRGNFEYNKLPQGLTYASSNFQKFINYVMHGTDSFCFCCVDVLMFYVDILVFSKNEEQHKIHLHKIANRLNAYSLKLNMKKCLIGLIEITALGYTLSAKGITASQEKVKAIQQLPEPTTIKELRQALGLINYQRKFIPNAAGILASLTAYLKGNVTNAIKIALDYEAKQAFIDIKQTLANIAGLAHSSDNAVLSLRTDASHVAIGAILEQKVDGNAEVLAYFSKTVSDVQRHYSTFDLELLSVYCAIKYFEYILLDKSFTVYIDNKALVNGFKKPSEKHTSKQVKQLSYISQFDCTLCHLPDKQNEAADCLSRFTVNYIFEQHNLPITFGKFVLAQKPHINTDIFNFPSNSQIKLSEITIPDSSFPLLVDTSLGIPRILLTPFLEEQIILLTIQASMPHIIY